MSVSNLMELLPFYGLTPVEYIDTVFSFDNMVRNILCNEALVEYLRKSLPQQISEGINCKLWNEQSFNQECRKK